MLHDEARGDDRVKHLRERVLAHSDPPADLKTPPRCFGVPPRLPVGGVRAQASVLKPFDVRAVEARMCAVEKEKPAASQDAGNLRDDGWEVLDIGRDPRGDHGPERAVAERQAGPVPAHHLPRPLPCETQLVGGVVQSDHGPPGRFQRAEQQSGPAPEVEAQPFPWSEQRGDLRRAVRDRGPPPLVVPLREPVIPRRPPDHLHD